MDLPYPGARHHSYASAVWFLGVGVTEVTSRDSVQQISGANSCKENLGLYSQESVLAVTKITEQ